MTAASGHILALDQGTSSSRAIVFDRHARPIARAQHELPSTFPAPGWVEQDADEIWQTQLRAGREALAAAGLTAADVAAIGITNQRETTIAWAPDGGPLAPAIVWQDRRTADRCAALRADGLEPLVRRRTGLVLDPYFSATKMAWLLDHLVDGRQRAEAGALRLGTVDTLAHRPTDGRSHLRHRRQQRQPDAPPGSWLADLVGGAARAVRDPRCRAARGSSHRRGLRA